MITLTVNSVEYTNFDDITVTSSIEDISGAFSFVAFTDATEPFPFNLDDPCQVKVDGTLVLTGTVETIKVSYSQKEHQIKITGRSKTASVVDSTLGDGVDFEGDGLSLKELIENILVKSKITDISVIDEVGNIPVFSAVDKMSGETGETVFDTMEKYARKRQVLLTTNGEGNIVITRGENQEQSFTLKNNTASPELNNIISATVTYDNSDRFTEYQVESCGNVAGLVKTGEPVTNKEIVGNKATSLLTESGKERFKVLQSETPMSTKECKDRADWEANIDRTRSFEYSAIVRGFTNELTGNVWIVNKLVSVDDIFGKLDGQFLVQKVKYRASLDRGSTTIITMVTKDAYEVKPDQDATEKATNTASLTEEGQKRFDVLN